jgi:DNA-binding response OmpR family regulator
MKSKAMILLVEDDKNLGFICREFLELEGYYVDLECDGVAGLKSFQSSRFDLVLLDIMLPKMDGITLAKEIKKQNKHIPIVFLTAKNMSSDIVKGFKMGADDYITKPFNTEVLKLRLEAVLRRTQNMIPEMKSHTEFTIGSAYFDFASMAISCSGKVIKLTKKEAELLRLFCINKNSIISRETALKTIWGENDYFLGRSMDVHVAKLRKILKSLDAVSIETVHGQGFKLVES